mgnify:CR=1 FL=1
MKDILARESPVPLRDAQLVQFARFAEALLEQNKVMNLTAITEPAAIARLHFLDCLHLLQIVPFAGKRVVDIGCGAGFPGVPLKIAQPELRLTLLDSLGKRMRWLEQTLPALGVEAQTVTARAEEYVAGCREQFDIATSRAVARLNILAELCLPYVKPGGYFLAMKGAMAQEETDEAARAIRRLGGTIEQIAEYPIADAVHKVVVVRKAAPTPSAYPRPFAKIKKAPL